MLRRREDERDLQQSLDYIDADDTVCVSARMAAAHVYVHIPTLVRSASFASVVVVKVQTLRVCAGWAFSV